MDSNSLTRHHIHGPQHNITFMQYITTSSTVGIQKIALCLMINIKLTIKGYKKKTSHRHFNKICSYNKGTHQINK